MIRLHNGSHFSFHMIGEFQSDGAWSHPRTTIDTYEIILVLSGVVFIQEGDISYELHPNDVLILEPHKIHGGYRISTPPTSFYWCHFYTDLPMKLKHVRGADLYDIKYYLKRLLHMANSSYSTDSADALCYLIVEELEKLHKEKAFSNPVLIHQVNAYIKSNIARNLTVTEIAKHFGYSPNYIGSLFQKNHNMRLKAYISGQRIKLAKDFLLTTNLTVKQIAHSIGYTDENSFVKFFKYHEKVSPTAFRTKYCNTHINSR